MRRAVLPGLLLLGLASLPAAPGDETDKPAAPKEIVNSIGLKMVLIPAGTFTMGSPESEKERLDIETQHTVEISKPFYLGAYEVTQAQFQKVGGAPNRSRFKGSDLPVENLNWHHTNAFLARLSNLPAEKTAGRRYRLPTEAEWEYACRAGTTTPFNCGESLSAKLANFNGAFPYGGAEKGPYLRQTCKVGSYQPNAWGLYDMHGNVQEWCSDYYDPDYYKSSPKKDPHGPAKGVLSTDYKDFYRVVRGGSWLDEGRGCRSAYRWRAMPSDAYQIVGVRVVCDVSK
jgi:formylglycine-generating enzyme required for sulfatase activity